MRIFVYEFITGGGLLDSADEAPLQALAPKGAAMAVAVANDFAALAATDVVLLADARLTVLDAAQCRLQKVSSAEEERAVFDRLAAESDWTLIIAPEFEGHLLTRCRRVTDLGGRLLGSSPEVIALASDKQRTAEHLAASGITTPAGVSLEPRQPLPIDFPYPAVLKPCDGAGSLGLRRIDHPPGEDFPIIVPEHGAMRLERFHSGLPASAALLCGPAGNASLAACGQRISDDGEFQYLGGALPLPAKLACRAERLAARAVASLQGAVGYIGFDLILGDDPAGDEDAVIEINPRLTTSYVGLRAASRDNLAGAMLEVAQGRKASLSFREDGLQFDADGTVYPAR